MEDVVGTWMLVSFDIHYQDGTRGAPYGDRPYGILHYAPDGLMLVHITNRGAAPIDAPTQRFPKHISYAARYRIEGDRVVHNVIVSALEAHAGAELARQFTLEDDRLTLLVPEGKLTDRPALVRLVWERAANPQTGA